MAVSRMFKVAILGYNPIKEKLIDDLHKLGIIEISEIGREEVEEEIIKDYSGEIEKIQQKLQEINKLIDDLNFTAEFLSKFKQKKENKQPKVSSKKFQYTANEYLKIARNFNYNIIENVKKFNQEIQQINSKNEYLRSRINELLPWQKIKIEFEELKFENVKTLFGIISAREFFKFKKEIDSLNLYALNEINSTKEYVYFALMYDKEKEDRINEILKCFSVNIMDFSDIKGTIHKTIAFYKDEIKKTEERIKEIEEELSKYVSEYEKILVCIDYWSTIYQREGIKKQFLSTETTFLLKGWLREKDITNLMELNRKYKEIHINISPPEEGEVPPVALKNPALISPFEMVTKLFGVPGKGEPDPTPLLAPFFALFFAICLTDAGYGLVLLLLSYIILKKIKDGEGTQKLMKTLIISGAVTVLVGAITGGWFGIDFDKLPETFKAIKRIRDKLVILEPLKDPLALFVTTLALGVIQVLTGIIIKFVMLIKHRNYYEAFTSPFAWFLIVTGILSAVILKYKLLWALPLTGALIILIFSDRSGNIIVRLLKGAYSLYGITGIFGDVLSYSRLFALALSTGVIALVINVVVGILYQMIVSIPYIGIPIGILFGLIVLVFGHIFNIVINSLGGFIHTTRLQFVEYFGKFYEGSGTEFKPFKQTFKYVDLV